MKQARIEGCTNLLIYICLPIGIFFYYKWLKYHEKNDNNLCDGKDFMMFFTTIGGGALILIFLIASIFTISDTIACFFNPEYMALKSLLGMLKSAK